MHAKQSRRRSTPNEACCTQPRQRLDIWSRWAALSHRTITTSIATDFLHHDPPQHQSMAIISLDQCRCLACVFLCAVIEPQISRHFNHIIGFISLPMDHLTFQDFLLNNKSFEKRNHSSLSFVITMRVANSTIIM